MLYSKNIFYFFKNFINDPLVQFEIFNVENTLTKILHFLFFFNIQKNKINITGEINDTVLPITNLIVFFIIFIMLSLIFFRTSSNSFNLNNWNYLNFLKIQVFSFAENVIKANSSLKKQNWFLILFFSFFLIVGVNLIGLIPYVFTITSSFIITFTYSLIIFICINILGIFRAGFFKFFAMFLPSGTPLSITFLLILIELISYIARLFSLSIRLFANMMAGHTLSKILIGFSFAIIFNNFVLFPVAIIPWLIVTIIFILEVLIGMLQGYVYLILCCIYINDVVLKH